MISMIASVGKNRELGKNNDLIWHFKQDMKFFKETTMGHIVVMGYNTYKSLPGDLPGRHIKVVSSKKLNDVEVYNGIQDLVDEYINSDEEIFICGGARIYSQFLPYASKLYLTEIDDEDLNADTFFPAFNKKEWKKEILDKGTTEKFTYKMCIYVRK